MSDAPAVVATPLLEAQDVRKTSRLGAIEVPVLHGASLAVREGEWLAVMGSSGSGKSTLVTQILVPAIQAELDGFGGSPKGCSGLEGDLRTLEHLEFVDQNPIGKSSGPTP